MSHCYTGSWINNTGWSNKPPSIGTPMIHQIQRIYGYLRYWGYVRNQREFSELWLGQCPSYFSSIKARGLPLHSNAALSLLARLRHHQQLVETSDAARTNSRMDQLNSMFQREAQWLSEQLYEQGIQRAAQRYSNHLEHSQ